MLFNPKATRYSFRQLFALAMMTRTDLMKQLDDCAENKKITDYAYSLSRKTELERKAYNEDVAALKARSANVTRMAYEYLRHELLVSEAMYGFGMAPPVMPQSAIEIIPSQCWLSLTMNPDKSEAFGHGLHYVGIFFQRAEDLPAETIALVKERHNAPPTAKPDAGKTEEQIQDTKTNTDHYVSPFIELQQDAARHFNIDPANPPYKETVIEWISAEAQKRGIKISSGNIERMATFIRNPESQKGGNRVGVPKKDETPA